jgi:3-oxoacyl-[acyl-carrier protein] reductase
MPHPSLTGQVALVTGGATGYGLSLATALAEAGANVVICGRRAGKLASATARLVSTQPAGDIFSTTTDVTDAEEIRQLAAEIQGRYGRLDLLINNAGILPEAATWEEQELANIDAVLNTNLRGPILVTTAFLPTMKKHNFGRILNITSGLGWKTVAGFGPYSASKAGLNSFTRTLAAELSGWNILVNAMDPGVAKTDLNPYGKDDPAKIRPGALRLLSLPQGGPSGRIFKKDGETEAVI